jgi:hypothetical protein
MSVDTYTHTHTHTHIYIYTYASRHDHSLNNRRREELETYMLKRFNFETAAFKTQAEDMWRESVLT